MKILIVGATGMIGSRVVTEAADRGHEVIAGSRSGGSDDRPNVRGIALDVNDTAAVRRWAREVDVVVSAVSPRNTEDPVAEAGTFTRSLIDAIGENRLVLVGGASSLVEANGTPLIEFAPDAYRKEAEGMLGAYDLLAASSAEFTVIAPAQKIAPGERTGNARLGDRTVVRDADGVSKISAEDYAVVLVDEIERPQHRRTIFNAAY